MEISNYQVRYDRPVPTKRTVRGKWSTLAMTMAIGGSLDVEKSKVNSLISAMRKLGYGYRSEQNGNMRTVWRTK